MYKNYTSEIINFINEHAPKKYFSLDKFDYLLQGILNLNSLTNFNSSLNLQLKTIIDKFKAGYEIPTKNCHYYFYEYGIGSSQLNELIQHLPFDKIHEKNINTHDLLLILPLYMSYENQFNGHKQYEQIYRIYQSISTEFSTFDTELQLIFILSLLNSIETMSETIFEYYKGLKDLVKHCVMTIDLDNTNEMSKFQFSFYLYVVQKAIKLYILNDDFKKVVDPLLLNELAELFSDRTNRNQINADDLEWIGNLFSAYTEYLKLSY